MLQVAAWPLTWSRPRFGRGHGRRGAGGAAATYGCCHGQHRRVRVDDVSVGRGRDQCRAEKVAVVDDAAGRQWATML